jgi:hypothetical protein
MLTLDEPESYLSASRVRPPSRSHGSKSGVWTGQPFGGHPWHFSYAPTQQTFPILTGLYNSHMGALDQLESFLQDLMERPAWLLMPKRLQPVQLAGALTKEIEERAIRLADRIVVPSTYTLLLSPEDFQRIQDVQPTLELELAGYVERLALERDLTLPADPAVQLRSDASVRAGRISVQSAFAGDDGAGTPLDRLRDLASPSAGRRSRRSSPPAPRTGRAAGGEGPSPLSVSDGKASGVRGPRRNGVPVLTLLAGDGTEIRSFPLDRPSMTLGRRSSNEIPIPDVKVSRHHARFEIVGVDCFVADLESTNGTRVNGQDISGRVRLEPGDIIEVGLQQLRYNA